MARSLAPGERSSHFFVIDDLDDYSDSSSATRPEASMLASAGDLDAELGRNRRSRVTLMGAPTR